MMKGIVFLALNAVVLTWHGFALEGKSVTYKVTSGEKTLEGKLVFKLEGEFLSLTHMTPDGVSLQGVWRESGLPITTPILITIPGDDQRQYILAIEQAGGRSQAKFLLPKHSGQLQITLPNTNQESVQMNLSENEIKLYGEKNAADLDLARLTVEKREHHVTGEEAPYYVLQKTEEQSLPSQSIAYRMHDQRQGYFVFTYLADDQLIVEHYGSPELGFRDASEKDVEFQPIPTDLNVKFFVSDGHQIVNLDPRDFQQSAIQKYHLPSVNRSLRIFCGGMLDKVHGQKVLPETTILEVAQNEVPMPSAEKELEDLAAHINNGGKIAQISSHLGLENLDVQDDGVIEYNDSGTDSAGRLRIFFDQQNQLVIEHSAKQYFGFGADDPDAEYSVEPAKAKFGFRITVADRTQEISSKLLQEDPRLELNLETIGFFEGVHVQIIPKSPKIRLPQRDIVLRAPAAVLLKSRTKVAAMDPTVQIPEVLAQCQDYFVENFVDDSL